jgi:hypothetical protein
VNVDGVKRIGDVLDDRNLIHRRRPRALHY